MHSQPNPADTVGIAEDSFDEALLGLLLDDHPGLWSVTELTRSLQDPGRRTEQPAPRLTGKRFTSPRWGVC